MTIAALASTAATNVADQTSGRDANHASGVASGRGAEQVERRPGRWRRAAARPAPASAHGNARPPRHVHRRRRKVEDRPGDDREAERRQQPVEERQRLAHQARHPGLAAGQLSAHGDVHDHRQRHQRGDVAAHPQRDQRRGRQQHRGDVDEAAQMAGEPRTDRRVGHIGEPARRERQVDRAAVAFDGDDERPPHVEPPGRAPHAQRRFWRRCLHAAQIQAAATCVGYFQHAIAGPQARLVGRAAGLHLGHQRRRGPRQVGRPRQLERLRVGERPGQRPRAQREAGSGRERRRTHHQQLHADDQRGQDDGDANGGGQGRRGVGGAARRGHVTPARRPASRRRTARAAPPAARRPNRADGRAAAACGAGRVIASAIAVT